MKIMAIEKEITNIKSEEIKPHLVSEAAKVWELYSKGIIREIYFQKEQRLAVIILECKDVREAQAVVRSLPLVRAGFIDFSLSQLVPYDGFARLFA